MRTILVYCLMTRAKLFRSIEDIARSGECLQNLGLSLALMTFEQEENFFIFAHPHCGIFFPYLACKSYDNVMISIKQISYWTCLRKELKIFLVFFVSILILQALITQRKIRTTFFTLLGQATFNFVHTLYMD